MGTWGLNAVEPGTFVVLNVSLCASSAQLELDVVFGSFHKLIVLITLILFLWFSTVLVRDFVQIIIIGTSVTWV